MPQPQYTGQVHTSADQVVALLDQAARSHPGHERVQVVLMPLDTTWNPASTKHPIYGPGVVTYDRYPDGAVEAHLS